MLILIVSCSINPWFDFLEDAQARQTQKTGILTNRKIINAMIGCGPWRGLHLYCLQSSTKLVVLLGMGRGGENLAGGLHPGWCKWSPLPHTKLTPLVCHPESSKYSNILECILVFKITTSFYYFLRITFKCVCISVCVCRYMHTHANREVRGQPWLFVLVSCPSCVLRQLSPWPGTHQVAYIGWQVSPSDLPVSVSPTLGLQMHMPLHLTFSKF